MTNTSRSIVLKKKELRSQILGQIAALDSSYTTGADHKIRELLLSLPEYRKAETVFCFVGTDHEIDTIPFLEQVLRDGKTLCVPLCRGKRRMEARRITSLTQLQKGSYGIPEPDPDSTPIVQPSQIDLSVIPCVTCSHTGVRLGHGGGYYDTYFHEHLPGCTGTCSSKDTGRYASGNIGSGNLEGTAMFFSENTGTPASAEANNSASADKGAGMAAVMICRERVITEDIPQEVHDLVFPFVVTEAGIFVAGRKTHV